MRNPFGNAQNGAVFWFCSIVFLFVIITFAGQFIYAGKEARPETMQRQVEIKKKSLITKRRPRFPPHMSR